MRPPFFFFRGRDSLACAWVPEPGAGILGLGCRSRRPCPPPSARTAAPRMTTPIDPSPSKFQVQVADRVTRLPPYLFGRINAALYAKRRAGEDVIDLGMGNPSDPPQEVVIEKLAEAARDVANHGYS